MADNRIHPSAIIGKQSQLNGVTVKAFCLIEDGVSIGRGTTLGTGTIIKRGSEIGKGNIIGENVIIGADPQDVSFDTGLKTGVQVGDNNVIREMVSIHRATAPGGATVIGDGCFLMGVSHYAHDVSVGNKVIVANNSLLAGHVQIGEGTFISGGCAIHQFVRIGRQVMIAGLSKVAQDVPPFCLAEGYPVIYKGLNSVGLKRAHFSPPERKVIKEFYLEIFKPGELFKDKLDGLAKKDLSPLEREILDFFLTTKRGVIRNK